MTAPPPSFRALLGDRRVVAVVRHRDPAVASEIALAAAAGGLRAVEITLTVPGAAELIAALRATLPADVLVGAGTVLSAADADAVLRAGAHFVVSPGMARDVLDRCTAASPGVAFLPGAWTPTEAMAAAALGLDAVKLFPSDSGGTAHLRALRSVLPGVAFVPTGGVTAANAAGWLRAGAHALGLAGELDAAHRDGGSEGVGALARALRAELETGSGATATGRPTTAEER